MSAVLKNLHVHFDDEVLSTTKKIMDDELKRKYSRDQLMALSRADASKQMPRMFDLSGADDKRLEKVRHVLKNSDIWKSWCQKNGADGSMVTSKGGVESNEQARTNFQQMISAAVSNAQQQNVEYANNRRRIGSGRIPDNYSARDNIYAIGMDVRYMRNKLFKDDGKTVKNWKTGMDLNWMNSESAHNADDTDNTDAKSDEPEWANCGPISKHDVIELHGFDGPEEDETQKSETLLSSPPARNSTPSKTGCKKSSKMDEHFNFEDFLKLDLPPSVNCSRDLGPGESRFSQWFGRDKHAHNVGAAKTTQQFFDYHQKASQKKMNAPNKLRSVDELEADWCPTSMHGKPKEPKAQPQADVNSIRTMLNQLALSAAMQKQRTMNTAQSNFLLSLINKSAEKMYHYRLAQNAIMKRPDAQLLLHRLVNGEITQYHILQQINNPNNHQRDRDTLHAVFAFCNENQQWLLQQQEQQMKHREHMSQQFRQLQMIQMKNGNMNTPPTPQELQFHTQTIMQNAVYKKQVEDQYRQMHGLKTGQSSKFPNYKTNNYMPNQSKNYYKQKQTQYGQNGLQFIQSQNKSMWNRQNQNSMPFLGSSFNSGMRNNNDLLAATMPSFSMANENKVPITVDK